MPPRKRWTGPRSGEGRLNENVFAFLETFIAQVRLCVFPDDTEGDEFLQGLEAESGDTIRLVFIKAGRPTYLTLTALTLEEFSAFKEILNMAFEMAEPVIKERDRKAQDAYDKGDDSYSRIYRQVPRLVVRKRPVRSDGQGVHDGPEGDASGSGGDRAPDGGVRVLGAELADGEQEGSRAEDDAATPD